MSFILTMVKTEFGCYELNSYHLTEFELGELNSASFDI